MREDGAMEDQSYALDGHRAVKTHVIWKHPGHLTSMKNEFGSGTIFFSLWVLA